jgi:hypothetical protein
MGCHGALLGFAHLIPKHGLANDETQKPGRWGGELKDFEFFSRELRKIFVFDGRLL